MTSLLKRMTEETPTQFWSDSCEVTSLRKAIGNGATGATSNPVIVLDAIAADPERWRAATRRLIDDAPAGTEVDVAWRLVEQVALEGAALLRPLYERSGGRRGHLCIQVNPQDYRSAARMIEQAMHFAGLAPNVAVKLPAVEAGVVAAEELTARGVVINATVSFTVPQALAIAEAVERGLARAAHAGLDTSRITPYVTIMVGRLDDHLRDVAKATGAAIDPELLRHASTATFRKAYRLYRERGYRATLLSAAMRSHHHWSEFIGGEVVITIPPKWQDVFDASGVEVAPRIAAPVDPALVELLRATFPDFRRAYDEDGMSPPEFVAFGATRKTLTQFLGGYDELVRFVRAAMIPPA